MGGTTEYDLSRPLCDAMGSVGVSAAVKGKPAPTAAKHLVDVQMRQVLRRADEWMGRLVPRVWFVVQVEVVEILAAVAGPRTWEDQVTAPAKPHPWSSPVGCSRVALEVGSLLL